MESKSCAVDLSACGFMDPQQQLGMALAQNDLEGFRSALGMGAEPELEDENHSNIFAKALKTYGCSNFVLECLNQGCNPNYINQFLNKAAINFATDSRDPSILEILLQQKGVDAHLDRKYSKLTPLNSLAKNLTDENVDDVYACMQLLLKHGASPNIPDQREMTPLHYVLKNGKINEQKKREFIQLFLEQAENLDIDSYRDGEVRSILSKHYADLEQLIKQPSATDITIDRLLIHLRSCELDQFLKLFEQYCENCKDIGGPKNLIVLFIEAIKRGLPEAFDAILQRGVNVNEIHNGNSAIEIAAIWGNWLALKKLLTREDLNLRPKDTLLITAVKKFDDVAAHERCDYHKCFYVLLESERVNINETDRSGFTALHFAVKYRNRKAIQELLKKGAYIGIKSKFHDLAIEDMAPEILEEHFDYCVNTNALKTGEDNFEIIMNYVNLMPRQGSSNSTANPQIHDEITPIAFLAKSKEHRYLLQHPLITSFLFLKWHRLSAIFYINFICYVLFTVAIITHTILKFRESEHAGVTGFFGLLVWIGIGYLVIREAAQILMSPFMYFRSLTNYMEIALILLSIITCISPKYDLETQRVLAVLTIILVALELCLLVGSLPVLSIATHMRMLQAVSASFIKSFALYSIFVITFSLCFYILLGKTGLNENGKPNNETGFNNFNDPLVAITKTIVMLTGEFDASDIGLDNLYSYLIFLLFVFSMSIVLFNLLNGLAVSDTQAIKAEAELNGSISRANVLARYEEVMTGKGRANFIAKHEPFRSICRRLLNVYPNYIAACQIAILPNDGNKVMIPITTTILKRDDEVRNSKTKILPSDQLGQKRILDPPVRGLACCFPCVSGRCAQMDKRTVKQALCLLERKTTGAKEKEHLQNTERRLENIEQKLEQMFTILKDIKTK